MSDRISRKWLIKQLESEKEYRSNRGERGAEKGLCYALEIVDDMPTAQEWILFAHWVASEVIDEKNWDLNCISFPEIACRKLNKLGIIDTDGRRWIYTPPKEEEE